jgi:two-component system sensor histidine kinase DegS
MSFAVVMEVGDRVATRNSEDSSLAGDLLSLAHEDGREALERRLRRLAFDLHDGALQELAALAFELAAVRRQVVPLVGEGKRDRVEGRFDDVHARLAGLDESLRSLVGALRGGRDSIEALDVRIVREVSSLREDSGIEVELEISGSFGELTESRRIAIFQIVREALSNISEHSGAQHVRVRVIEHDGTVEVSVEDDGRGFDRDAAALEASALRRFGLTGMIERVRMLGSELEIESALGEGTRIGFVLDAWEPAASAAIVSQLSA